MPLSADLSSEPLTRNSPMSPAAASERSSPSTTHDLVERIGRGDATAFGRLLVRCLPALRRWAHGRLPRWTRTAADTSDLVQDALLRTLRRADAVDVRGHQALSGEL